MKLIRPAALCAIFLARALISQAADATPPKDAPAEAAPPPVIERAPVAADDVAGLRLENRRLTGEVEAQTKRADEASARLNTINAGIERLISEKNTAQTQLAEAKATVDALRQKLDAAEKASTQPPPDTTGKIADLERKLSAALERQATLEADNQLLKTAASEQVRLTAELEKIRQAKATEPNQTALIADLKKQLAETQDKLATTLHSYSLIEQENDKLKAAPAPAAPDANAELAALRRDKAALEAKLAAAPSDNTAELRQKLVDAEGRLNAASQRATQLETENQQLKAAAGETAAVRAEAEALRKDKAGLEAKLATAPTDASEDLKKKLADTEERLNTTLRSYSQLQAEQEQLKKASGDTDALRHETETLRHDNAELQAKSAMNAPATPDAAARVADLDNKLTTVLRSYSLVQAENDQLKASLAKAIDSAQATAAKQSNDSATQLNGLFDQLRQTQAQATSLAAENAGLKTRLALAGSPPGSTLSSPVRPGTAAAASAATPPPAPVAAPTPAGPKTHVVAAGDTLAKLARTYYGNANRWDEILEANRDVVKNENVLPVGATLKIP